MSLKINNVGLLVIGVTLFLVANALADKPPFVYDEHGKHDPFTALVTPTGVIITFESDLSVGDLILEGIVADSSGNNAAIINGKIVSAGDVIGTYTVESIGVDEVQVIQGDQRSVVKLKKGGL